MIVGIVLAAGEGKRINKHKLTLSLGPKVVIDWVLEAAVKSTLDRVFLVVKTDDEEIAKIGRKYNANIIYNPDYKKGMSSSIKKALLELDNYKDIDGFCILLGDQPFVKYSTINLLIKEFKKGKKEIIVPYYQGNAGNPVLFDIYWKNNFKEIRGDVGGRILIKAHPDKVKKVVVEDDAILFDIDKEEDYQKAKSFFITREKECN